MLSRVAEGEGAPGSAAWGSDLKHPVFQVMEPFATSLAWIIWFVVLVLGLLVLNILLFCIFPFNTRWLLGGYAPSLLPPTPAPIRLL